MNFAFDGSVLHLHTLLGGVHATLHDSAGNPVWPVSDIAELTDLQSGLAAWGVQLEVIGPEYARASVVGARDRGMVCVLGDHLAAVGRLYGHLTNRAVVTISTVQDIESIEDAKIVIALWPDLETDDYETIFKYSTHVKTVGLIAAGNVHDLSRRLLKFAAHVARSRSSRKLPEYRPAAVTGYGDLEAGRFATVARPDSDPEEIAVALSGTNSVLGIVCHSDGIDAKINSHAILCSRVEPIPIDLGASPPNCDVTGYCQRLHRARVDALASGQLVSPSLVSARVLLMLSSYVAHGSDSAVGAHAGLLDQLLASQRVGPVVTSWEVVEGRVEHMTMLTGLLDQGLSVGDAVGTFYRTVPGGVEETNRYILFGDPEIRAANRDILAALPELAAAPRPASRSTPDAGGATGLVWPWLAFRIDRINTDPRFNANGTLRVARDRLREAQRILGLRQASSATLDEYQALLRTVLAYEGRLFTHWYEDAATPAEFVCRATQCFGCGLPGRLFRLQTQHGARWIANCTRCECSYADVPSGSDAVDNIFSVANSGDILRPFAGEADACLISINSSLNSWHVFSASEPLDLCGLPPGRSWLWLYSINANRIQAHCRLVDNRP